MFKWIFVQAGKVRKVGQVAAKRTSKAVKKLS